MGDDDTVGLEREETSLRDVCVAQNYYSDRGVPSASISLGLQRPYC